MRIPNAYSLFCGDYVAEIACVRVVSLFAGYTPISSIERPSNVVAPRLNEGSVAASRPIFMGCVELLC